MTFNINRIKDNIAGYGYLKQNKFEVFVQSPSIFQNSSLLNANGNQINISSLNDTHRFRIEQVRAPGVSLLSSDVRRYGIGPTQKFPYNAQYFDTTFSVLVDKNTSIWDFWYNWVNSIFNFNGTEASNNRIPTYTSKYKDDYSTIMMIVIYDDFGNTVKTINLYDAFPSSVKEIPLAWGDSQTLLRLAVSITYSTYTIAGSTVENNTSQQRTVPASATSSTPTTITA
jgi:hypothetical protein